MRQVSRSRPPAPGQGLIERKPQAILGVDGVDLLGVDVNGGPELDQPLLREDGGVDARVVQLGRRPQHVAGTRREDDLGERLCGGEALRVGRRTGGVQRVHRPLVPNLAPPGAAGEKRSLQPFAAARHRRVSAQAVRAAVPGGLGARVEAPSAEVVSRVLREQGHDPAEGVAAVEGGVRAPHDLDRLQRVDIERHLVDVEGPEVELLRRLDAVDAGQHPIPADAADVEAVEAQPGDVALDVDARLVLHEVGRVLDQPLLDRLLVDDRHHPRRLPHRGRAQRSSHGHRVEKRQRIVGGRRRSGRSGVGPRLRRRGRVGRARVLAAGGLLRVRPAEERERQRECEGCDAEQVMHARTRHRARSARRDSGSHAPWSYR